MTVRELVEELNRYPDDKEVKVNSNYWGCEVDISSVIIGYECVGDHTVILDITSPDA